VWESLSTWATKNKLKASNTLLIRAAYTITWRDTFQFLLLKNLAWTQQLCYTLAAALTTKVADGIPSAQIQLKFTNYLTNYTFF
jgi:hypothetical protein